MTTSARTTAPVRVTHPARLDDLIEAIKQAHSDVLDQLSGAVIVVDRVVHREPMQAVGAALLALAWQHRDTLLS